MLYPMILMKGSGYSARLNCLGENMLYPISFKLFLSENVGPWSVMFIG